MASSVVRASSRDPRLSAYRVVSKVGKGSYGDVFLVRHHTSKKQYVMKNINLGASNAKERLAAEQEAALLSQLHHPNIVSYRESFQDECAVLHIIMGYCEGGDLCTRLKQAGDQLFPETQVVEWFVQIALALQYLHDKNILHRDLKTQNIFLSKSNIIKVGDLGIARVLDGSCELAQTVIGTPYYMSPELFANQPYNHKSDIWALGCCVYEMATLKHAFNAKNINALMYKILQGKVPPLPSQFSEDLSNLVQLMMARDAGQRPSVHEILRMGFIRRHIKMFLERTSSKRRKKPSPSSSGVCLTDSGFQSEEREQGSSSSDQRKRQSRSVSSPPEERPGEGRRSSSTPSLPQASLPQVSLPQPQANSPSVNKQCRDKEPLKQNKVKKPARPLPPAPATSRQPESPQCDSPKPPSGRSGLSARERRRRNRQEGGVAPVRSKVVLRSRSSSDPRCPRKRSKEGGEDCTDHGGGEPVVQLASEDAPPISVRLKPSSSDESSHPPTGGSRRPRQQGGGSTVDRDNGGKGDGSPPVTECDGGGVVNGGRAGESDEVEEFYSLLDTTLHLPEPSQAAASSQQETLSEVGPPKQAFTDDGPHYREREADPLPSGRLGDRIRSLREECVRGLGEEVVVRALKVLETATDLEQPENQLLVLLGNSGVESYGAKLQQLKLCEDSLCML